MKLEEFKKTGTYDNIKGKSMEFTSLFKNTPCYKLGDYLIYYTGDNYRNFFNKSHIFEEYEWGIDFIEYGKTKNHIIVYLS